MAVDAVPPAAQTEVVNPLRALVVEDEKIPRELLRDRVPWAALGFDRVDTARNGLEALALLEAGDVDLVVTDVRMPKMDGVELALRVRERWPGCILVFLSGYSDKEYLKTAIRVQAQDYLDKPIDLEVVSKAVATAAATLREACAVRELSPLRRQAQVEALLGLGTLKDVTLGQRFRTGPFRVAAVVPSASPGPTPGWRQRLSTLVNAETFPQPSFSAAPGPEGSVVLVWDPSLGAEPGAFDHGLEALLDLLQAAEPDTDLKAGVSAAVAAAGGLPRAVAEARSALVDAFYRPAQRVFPVRPRAGRVLDFPPETRDLWEAALGAKDHPGLTKLIDAFGQRTLAVRDDDLDRVRRVWLSALDLVLAHVPGWGPAERGVRRDKLVGDFARAANWTDLTAAARDCHERLFLWSPADLQAGERIQKARAFIEARYTDPDLTVDVIAAHVGYSESYFCTVFKQAQGTTVKDFVNGYRIDRAKAYLWEKNPPTLADLALKVGFRDPNYFGTVFRRLTGTTPGAYRKKALG